MTVKRSRSTPKKYKQKDPDYEKRTHRKLCPTCLEHGKEHYMSKAVKRFRSEADTSKIKWVSPLWFCEICRTVIWNEEDLKKIPK